MTETTTVRRDKWYERLDAGLVISSCHKDISCSLTLVLLEHTGGLNTKKGKGREKKRPSKEKLDFDFKLRQLQLIVSAKGNLGNYKSISRYQCTVRKTGLLFTNDARALHGRGGMLSPAIIIISLVVDMVVLVSRAFFCCFFFFVTVTTHYVGNVLGRRLLSMHHY